MRSSFKGTAILTGLVTAAVLLPGMASASPVPDSASSTPRKMCAGNKGAVAGTNGIYNLRTSSVSCTGARKVVKKFHQKVNANGKLKQDVRGLKCKSHLTGGSEGLIVKCKKGNRSVKWTAYLQPQAG